MSTSAFNRISMTTIHYTLAERTVKRLTLNDILKSVRFILNEKKIKGICMNYTKNLRDNDMYTVAEANEIIDAIVDDSIYYA